VAGGLHALGVRPGDNVALVMPNCPQSVIAFFAVLRLGAAAVEHNPLYTSAELRHPFVDHGARVRDRVGQEGARHRGAPRRCGPRARVAVDMTTGCRGASGSCSGCRSEGARGRDQLSSPAPQVMQWAELASAAPLDESHPRPDADDVALLLYTSGTTGVPKGVPLLHRNLVSNVLPGRAWVPGLEEGKESFLVALPLFHAYGVTVSVLLGVALAAKLVLLPKPEIGLIMQAVGREVPSFVPAVPPLYQRIVDEAERPAVSIRASGSPCPARCRCPLRSWSAGRPPRAGCSSRGTA
jgi:long-chain acyl-CoA synthetase